MNNPTVALSPCPDYTAEKIREALVEITSHFDLWNKINQNTTVGIKANLVSAMSPDEAATTHPRVICELVKLITEHGGRAIVGDSPGGLYTASHLSHVYEVTGLSEVEKVGGLLNRNFEVKSVNFPEGKVLKSFTYTAWLDECDIIVDVCKLKTHGMIGMSAAAKNMFGTIPGVMKPEYHYRFPNLADFSNMLIDIDEYFKPALCICDAIEGMEGNGPTKGKPRHIGLMLASDDLHACDMVCADIIGLRPDDVPTLAAAVVRGLAPSSLDEINVTFDYKQFKISDYDNIAVRRSMLFDNGNGITRKLLSTLLSSRPRLKPKECIGCGKCARVCPAKAIKINEKKKAVIDRSRCIRCFCCQEFCPTGAMKVYRTPVARMLNKQ